MKWIKKSFFGKKMSIVNNKGGHGSPTNNETFSMRLRRLKLEESHQKIVLEFADYDDYKKYGKKIQQGLIDEWLKAKCENQSHRRVLKEIINNFYEIRTSRKDNSMFTIC